MEIIMKKSTERYDHPERHPGYAAAVVKGRQNIASGKFNLKGKELEHYKKMLRGNPNNVPGIPAFFPPIEIKEFTNFAEFQLDEAEALRRRMDTESRKIMLFCENCRGVRESTPVSRQTEHIITRHESYCTICGNKKPYHF